MAGPCIKSHPSGAKHVADFPIFSFQLFLGILNFALQSEGSKNGCHGNRFHVFVTKGLNTQCELGRGGGEPSSLEQWLGCVCLTVQTEVTVATECPSAKQRRGAGPSIPRSPSFLLSGLS